MRLLALLHPRRIPAVVYLETIPSLVTAGFFRSAGEQKERARERARERALERVRERVKGRWLVRRGLRQGRRERDR